jgi:ABC-type transport system involved in multi-copper enzyme maturation permease subunit
MFTALLHLEGIRLRKRYSVWFMFILSLFIGIGISLIILKIQNSLVASEEIHSFEQNMGVGIQDFLLGLLGTDISSIAGKALWCRNFYIIPLLLIFIASDISDLRSQKLLREMICQPITRKEIYASKILFLSGLSILSLLCTILPTISIASLYLEEWGAWKDLLGGIFLCFVRDLTIFGLVFALTTKVKVSTSGGTTLLVLFLLLIENIIRYTLYFILSLDQNTKELGEFLFHIMPGYALSSWSLWSTQWSLSPIISLCVICVVLHAIALYTFDRQDI